MAVKIDTEYFVRRVSELHKAFVEHGDRFSSTDALCIDAGKHKERAELSVSSAMQVHLINYEFPDTVMILTKKKFIVLTGRKKLEVLTPAVDEIDKETFPVEVQLVEAVKGSYDAGFATCLAAVREAGGKLGVIESKEEPEGRLLPGWRAALAAAEGVSTVDATPGFQYTLCVKDQQSVKYVTDAGRLSARLITKSFMNELNDVVDSGNTVKHRDVASKVENSLEEDRKITSKLGIFKEQADFLLTPVVQSGGTYEVRLNRMPRVDMDTPFSTDVIVVALASSVMGFGASIARTYFIDNTESQRQAYKVLLAAHDALIQELRPGKKIREAVEAARAVVRSKNPALLDKLPKSFGAGIGLQLRESTLALIDGNENVVRAGMTFSVTSSLAGVELTDRDTKKDKPMGKLETYSIVIGDTVVVGAKDNATTTEKAKVEFEDVSFDLNDDEEEGEGEDEDEDGAGEEKEDGGRTRFRSQRLRDREKETGLVTSTEKMREIYEQQLALFQKVKEDMSKVEIAKENGGGDGADETKIEDDAAVKEIALYKSPAAVPGNLGIAKLDVDRENNAVLVPMHGYIVPFHIMTIKNVVFNNSDSRVATLRLTFYYPGQAYGRDVPTGVPQICDGFKDSLFIKSLTFKAESFQNLMKVQRIIKDVQKRQRDKSRDIAEAKGIAETGDIKRIKDSSMPRLQDLQMRPVLSGRKSTGVLEAHKNGLLFISSKGEKLQILYSNIKHALFQPCDQEIVVLVHFSLKQPILVRKKKTYDLQFYTEVTDATVGSDARAASMYDRDELVEEERERKRRKKKNKEFVEFCRQVEAVVDRYDAVFPKFDKPERKLGFHGVPGKEMVLLQPTTSCLVNLTGGTPFVLSLDIVEHVHFERVSMMHKNFDMTFVLKEGKTMGTHPDPFVRIGSIPMNTLDRIKEWLTTIVGITFTEGQLNLNWKEVLGQVRSDPEFFRNGGWMELWGNVDGEGEDGSDADEDEDEGDEAFEEESEEESEDEIDSDEFEAEDSSEEESEEEDSEDEADWSDMEKTAREEDKEAERKRSRRDKEDGARSGKRSRKGD
uniref:FACT complex subunit n=1 Tax=Bicosoecida sp. CB-2014 TaxID=1486930 RepID=A0A7S1CB08_9STRA|mmetsp:Transcript_17693/g.62302  ORF Transcript_17693/g.62302 Transcript_17693/m.62302 type:complete len:1061 (+) Transcript_17693:226-3408(+)